MTSPIGQAVLAAMLSDAARLPEIADARKRIFSDRLRRAEPVIARAVERGELPADTDPGELLKTLAAPIYFRLLISAEPVDDVTAEHAAALALAAARGGVVRKK